MIELKYKKNEKFEIEFENLDEVKENNKVFLRLKDGDLTPLVKYIDVRYYEISDSYIGNKIYLPFCIKTNLLQDIYYKIGLTNFNIFCFDSENLDCDDCNFNNILPNWSKYIDKDSAILFLNLADCERYQTDEFSDAFDYSKVFLYPNIEHRCNKMICMSSDCTGIKDFKKCSIIIPELTSKNIQEINDIGKELKEKYGIEKVEVFASHCFVKISDFSGDKQFCIHDKGSLEYDIILKAGLTESRKIRSIDKITTTNSTGVLVVQDSERLKVVDVKEFFE